jgi:threonine dehydratase
LNANTNHFGIAEVTAAADEALIRIAPFVPPSPILCSQVHAGLFFKAENFQLTGSFKIRGALSKLTKRSAADLRYITASSGNHGIAVSKAAQLLGSAVIVVLPESVAKSKLEKIRQLGAEVEIHGAETHIAEAHARSLADEQGMIYISPYNDRDVIAGQATIALECLSQLKGKNIDNIYVSMGGGGLISGIGAVLKMRSPRTKIWGVSASNSAALAAAIAAGKVIDVPHLPTLADGVAGGMDQDSLTLPLATRVIDEILHCSEAEIAAALREMAIVEHQLVEGAGALALAGYRQATDQCVGQTNLVIMCGANVDAEILRTALAD